MDIAGGPVDEGVDSVNVGKLSSFGHVVGVTDLVSDPWTFPADLTATLDFGHSGLLPVFGGVPVQTHRMLLKGV